MKKKLMIIVVLGIVLLLGWMINEKRLLQVTPLPATPTTTTTVAPTTMVDPILDFKEALLLAKTDPGKALQSCPQTEERRLFCMLKVFCEASGDPGMRKQACDAYGIKAENCDVYLNACTDPKASFEECGNIFVGDEIEMCKAFVSELAAARGLTPESMDLCSRITHETMRFECLETVAILNKNLEMCGSIGTDIWAGRCYWEIAITYNEPEICNYIKNQTDIENCLEQVQNRHLNTSI